MGAKYPRTPHLPWSPGLSRDEKMMKDTSRLIGRPVIMTEKLDGSNVCFSQDGIHARSHNGPPVHPSFNWLKSYHATIREHLRPGVSVFAEYCYAVHSIVYDELPACLFILGERNDETGIWSSWDEVERTARSLRMPTAPVIFAGTFGSVRELESVSSELAVNRSTYGGPREGLVVRIQEAFADATFRQNLAKWVREGHVQTGDHWSTQAIRKQNVQWRTGYGFAA